MSCSHAIMFPKPITVPELIEFVESEGGKWQDFDINPSFRQGVIVNGDIWLFIRGVDTQEADLKYFSPEELSCAARKCGKRISAVLTVDHTKSPGGEPLADRIISHMTARWEGCEFKEVSMQSKYET